MSAHSDNMQKKKEAQDTTHAEIWLQSGLPDYLLQANM